MRVLLSSGVDNDPASLRLYPYECFNGRRNRIPFKARPRTRRYPRFPPCAGYSRGTAALPDRLTRYDRLIAVTREALRIVGHPHIIENVEDAKPELLNPLKLCWSMFYEPGSVRDSDGTPLTMRRHRLFETSFPVLSAGVCNHPRGMQVAGSYGRCAGRSTQRTRLIHKGGPRSAVACCAAPARRCSVDERERLFLVDPARVHSARRTRSSQSTLRRSPKTTEARSVRIGGERAFCATREERES